MTDELDQPYYQLYVGRWVDIVDGVTYRGDGQESWDAHVREMSEAPPHDTDGQQT